MIAECKILLQYAIACAEIRNLYQNQFMGGLYARR